MKSSIITSDRYIAIKSANGLTYNRTLRVLTKDYSRRVFIVPCRWSEQSQRLESVSRDGGPVPFMFEASDRLEKKLRAAGYVFEFLTEEQARSLTN